MELLKFCLLPVCLLALLTKVVVSQNARKRRSVIPKNMKTNDFKEKQYKDKPEFCSRGHFLNPKDNTCDPCLDDHFMPDPIHSQVRCYPCQHARPDSAEIDLINCTSSHDTVIACKEGYFVKVAAQYDSSLVKCYPCSRCHEMTKNKFETRPCGKAVDTLCCPDPNMTAVEKDGEIGYSCQGAITTATHVYEDTNYNDFSANSYQRREYVLGTEKVNDFYQADPTGIAICGRGQFLKINQETKKEFCQMCPDGTFMNEKRHYNTRCVSFSQISLETFKSQEDYCWNCEEYVIGLSAGLFMSILLNILLVVFYVIGKRAEAKETKKLKAASYLRPLLDRDSS